MRRLVVTALLLVVASGCTAAEESVDRTRTQLSGDWDQLAYRFAGPTVAANPCRASADPSRPGFAGQRRPPQGFGMGQKAALDAESGLIVYASEDSRIWLFDICTNTWRTRSVPDPGAVWGLAYDADSDLVVGCLDGVCFPGIDDVYSDTARR